MGILVSDLLDPLRAPRYFTNATGELRWSGMTAEQLEEACLLKVLFRDCRVEAYRGGWNRPDQKVDETCPFHPEFLDGEPRRVWIEAHYQAVGERERARLGANSEEHESEDDDEEDDEDGEERIPKRR